MTACADAPALPSGSRRVVAPAAISSLTGEFVAEVGVGVVHHAEPVSGDERLESSVTKLTRRIKAEFDPTGRLNPGVTVG
jgi:FAD/FMN-containing dehydrogenase